MADIETVVNGLNDIGGFIAGRVGFEQARNFLRTIDDVIDLLKEQEQDRIEIAHEMVSNSILMYQGKEIVRCKDCKKRNSWECWQYFFGRIKIPDDWYCADGEKGGR